MTTFCVFQKGAFFVVIRILSSLSFTFTRHRKEKAHFKAALIKVALICYIKYTFFLLMNCLCSRMVLLFFVWKSVQCFCSNSSIYIVLILFIFCVFIAIPHHTIVLAMFCGVHMCTRARVYVCMCMCVCLCHIFWLCMLASCSV